MATSMPANHAYASLNCMFTADLQPQPYGEVHFKEHTGPPEFHLVHDVHTKATTKE